MVPYNTGDVSGISKTTPSTAKTNQSTFQHRERTPPPAKTTPDRVVVIRESLRTKGLSQAATDILLSSWREAPKNAVAGELGLAGVLNGTSVPLLHL